MITNSVAEPEPQEAPHSFAGDGASLKCIIYPSRSQTLYMFMLSKYSSVHSARRQLQYLYGLRSVAEPHQFYAAPDLDVVCERYNKSAPAPTPFRRLQKANIWCGSLQTWPLLRLRFRLRSTAFKYRYSPHILIIRRIISHRYRCTILEPWPVRILENKIILFVTYLQHLGATFLSLIFGQFTICPWTFQFFRLQLATAHSTIATVPNICYALTAYCTCTILFNDLQNKFLHHHQVSPPPPS
jgi:hypothetical protein